MSEEQVLTELADIVREVTGIPADRVHPDTSFADDLDIDSLSMVEIVTVAEDRFGVHVPDDDYSQLRTAGEAARYLAAASAARA